MSDNTVPNTVTVTAPPDNSAELKSLKDSLAQYQSQIQKDRKSVV